jgi:hypothetical protein
MSVLPGYTLKPCLTDTTVYFLIQPGQAQPFTSQKELMISPELVCCLVKETDTKIPNPPENGPER